MFSFLAQQMSAMPVQMLPKPPYSSNSNHYWVNIFQSFSLMAGCFRALTEVAFAYRAV